MEDFSRSHVQTLLKVSYLMRDVSANSSDEATKGENSNINISSVLF